MTKQANVEDLDIMSRTLYSEARGEFNNGLWAVACVIKNRADTGYRGSTPKEVCLAYKQFSCWNDNDPQSKIIKNLSKDDEMY